MDSFIEAVLDMMDDKLCNAEKYIKCAFRYKESYPTVAAIFQRISVDDMNHVNLLNDNLSTLLTQNADKKTPMFDVFSYMHKKHITKINEIKALQAMYK